MGEMNVESLVFAHGLILTSFGPCAGALSRLAYWLGGCPEIGQCWVGLPQSDDVTLEQEAKPEPIGEALHNAAP